MRSELVHSAEKKVENRFQLSAMLMRGARAFHVNSTRTEDTLNRVLSEVASGRYTAAALPSVAPPPLIEELVLTPAL